MRRHLIALLLLLVFGGSLLASPHPCHPARGAEPESARTGNVSQPSQPSQPAAPSASHGCHGAAVGTASMDGHEGHGTPASAPAPNQDTGDPCGDEKGGCKHACHMVAVVGAQIALFSVQPQAQMVAPTFDRSLPLFAPPIDHIPLV